MKHKYLFTSLFFLFFLTSCGNKNEEAYTSFIQKGLDALAAEEYEKAEAYFEHTVEEKPEDEKANALLLQTKYFNQSLQSFEDNDYKSSLNHAKSVINIDNGSVALITKSEAIITDIKEIMNETNISQEANYTFEEFKGTYGFYESTPYESSLEYLIIITDSYFIDGELNAGVYLKNNILDKKIKENTLTIEFSTPELGGHGALDGNLSLKIENEDNQKTLIFTESNSILYPITKQHILDAGWTLPPEL
ncbi:hypothetical protein [Carnobacterium mobile]|uniref:hypothetical protein n=1 Tax=Carnobacterium mobile TaxID=2750 RepID=UPI00054E0915|nr:hypothetical protein [Carnobacterium mobile]